MRFIFIVIMNAVYNANVQLNTEYSFSVTAKKYGNLHSKETRDDRVRAEEEKAKKKKCSRHAQPEVVMTVFGIAQYFFFFFAMVSDWKRG